MVGHIEISRKEKGFNLIGDNPFKPVIRWCQRPGLTVCVD